MSSLLAHLILLAIGHMNEVHAFTGIHGNHKMAGQPVECNDIVLLFVVSPNLPLQLLPISTSARHLYTATQAFGAYK